MAGSMTVRVRLFAVLRQSVGRDSVEIQVHEGATVADALDELAGQPGLGEVLERVPVRMAVNRDYAEPATELSAGDELALVPPVSGGAPIHVRVGAEPISLEEVAGRVVDPSAGAVATFQGFPRDVPQLDYEAYGEMAEERIAAILAECVERHGLTSAAAEHRTGSVPVGEASVLVAVSAPHRTEAFAGAREAIDRIKAEAPIWKLGAETASVSSGDLTHLDESGRARMVDVGAKEATARRAVAEATLRMSPRTAAAISERDAPKGDVIGTARIAGIQAAKRTDELIPLAHPLPLTHVDVEIRVIAAEGLVEVVAEAKTTARTGVEMEAMTACAISALTVYDMAKALERGIRIERIELLEKSGGRSGEWRRSDAG